MISVPFSPVKPHDLICGSPGAVEDRIKEGKTTLRSDKTRRHRFASNQEHSLMEVLDYCLFLMLRLFCVEGGDVERSTECLIKRLIEVGAKVVYRCRRWQAHWFQPRPLSRYYRAVFG